MARSNKFLNQVKGYSAGNDFTKKQTNATTEQCIDSILQLSSSLNLAYATLLFDIECTSYVICMNVLKCAMRF